METEWLLIALYFPVLIFLLPLLFLYERFALNEDERVEQKFTITKALFFVGSIFIVVITFPLTCLGPLGSFIGLIFNGIFLVTRNVVEECFLRPIFWRIIPFIFKKWNQGLYRDFPLQEGHIRVLEIPQGSPSEGLSLKIKPEPLETATFEALSYSWGGHTILRRIIKVNGKSFLTTDSVLRALRELRYSNRKRVLWIDSICINQGDYAEKREQVMVMHSIYQRAQDVVVWLGKAPPGFTFADKTVRDISSANPEDFQSLAPNIKASQQAIQQVLSRRWWSRVWIIQEIALNSSVTVRVGEFEISWEVLSRFLRVAQMGGLGLDKKVLEYAATISELQSRPPDPPNGLLDLAVKFRFRVATMPHDKLYGLRALLRPDNPKTIDPDYRISARRVFTRFASADMISNQKLSMMALADSCHVIGCSWAADWQEMTALDWAQADPFDSTGNLSQHFTLFWSDRLLPSVIENSRTYSAAGPLSHSCSIGTDGRQLLGRVGWTEDPIKLSSPGDPKEWFVISVTGWEVDTIATVGELCDLVRPDLQQGALQQWLQLAGGPFKSNNTVNAASFCRTLLGDAWTRSSPPDRADRLLDSLRSQTSDETTSPIQHEITLHSLEAQSLENTPVSTPIELISQLAERNRSLQAACRRNRRFFKTSSGRFGLGSARCRSGDLVCALVGSPIPFVLGRPVSNMYECIGQAYVDGMMDYVGDLEQDIRDEKINLRRFLIR